MMYFLFSLGLLCYCFAFLKCLCLILNPVIKSYVLCPYSKSHNLNDGCFFSNSHTVSFSSYDYFID